MQIGEIRKAWSGFVKEIYTDADNFGVSFPLDLDVNVKACLLGAVFLIVSIRILLYTSMCICLPVEYGIIRLCAFIYLMKMKHD